MANGRKPVDLGFAEFAAQVVAELHEGLLVAQNEQESRRAKLAELSALALEEFARRFITNEQVEAELVRLFLRPKGKRIEFVSVRPTCRKQPNTPNRRGSNPNLAFSSRRKICGSAADALS
jgi:hypothetical protein